MIFTHGVTVGSYCCLKCFPQVCFYVLVVDWWCYLHEGGCQVEPKCIVPSDIAFLCGTLGMLFFKKWKARTLMRYCMREDGHVHCVDVYEGRYDIY